MKLDMIGQNIIHGLNDAIKDVLSLAEQGIKSESLRNTVEGHYIEMHWEWHHYLWNHLGGRVETMDMTVTADEEGDFYGRPHDRDGSFFYMMAMNPVDERPYERG